MPVLREFCEPVAVLWMIAAAGGLLVATEVQAQTSKPGVAAGSPGGTAAKAVVKPNRRIRAEMRTYDNWSVTCEEYEKRPGKPVCTAALKIVQRNTGRTLFAWLLAKQAKTGQVVGWIQTPTGVLIAPGVTFQFAAKTARKYGYTSCEQGRCSTIIPLGLALRREIARAKSGKISIVSTSGRRINFQINPKGFAKAYAAVLAIK